MTRFLESLSKMDIEARAEFVLQQAQLVGRTELVDVEALIERTFDLRLFIGQPEDIGQPKYVLGAIFFEEKEIFINDILVGAVGRYRFTLAHELGHWVLHQDVVDPIEFAWPFVPGKTNRGRRILCRTQDSSPIERQANIFAASLLMPRWSFCNKVHSLADELQLSRSQRGYIVSRAQHDLLIERLAGSFGVSREAARYRLVDTALVSVGDPAQLRLLL